MKGDDSLTLQTFNVLKQSKQAPSEQEWERAISSVIRQSTRSCEPVNAFDGQLLDTIKDTMRAGNELILSELALAATEDRITKRFYNLENMKQNLEDFLVERKETNFFNNPYYKKARKTLLEVLHMHVDKIEPLTFDENLTIYDVFSNLQASVGCLYPGKRKIDEWGYIRDVAKQIHKELPKQNQLFAIPYHRAQISGYVGKNGKLRPKATKHKDRLVWCVDAATVLIESLYARPFIDKVLTHIQNYAGGKDDNYISNLLIAWNVDNWISIDYSKYDSTVQAWLIKDVFDIIRSFFSKRDVKVLQWIENQFIHTRILDFDGNISTKHRGIPSGSYFTQIVGSLVNALVILTYEFARFRGNEAKVWEDMRYGDWLRFMTMGDDNIVFTRNKISLDDLASYVEHNFGLVINVEKCSSGNFTCKPDFLKRRWTTSGAERNILELLVNAIHPEYRREYEEKGFSPYHILYGYFYTYRGTMKRYFFETDIIKGMAENGGAGKLNSINLQDLPGSFRMLKLNNRRLWDRLIQRLAAAEEKLKLSAGNF